MQSGDLTGSVAFDAPTRISDGHGGTETGWGADDDAVKARAHFRWLRGSEPVIAARLQGRQPVVVTVRSSLATRAITPAWRMRDLHTGVVYNIRTGPVPSGDRLWLEFTCESGVAV